MLFDTDSGGGKYEIQKSLRFRASALAYLSRTPSIAGNRKTWTWSGWVKRGVLGVQKGIFECVQSAAPNVTSIVFNSDNTIGFQHYVNGGVSVLYTTGAVCRDPSAWYHLTFVLDTTISTAANRFKVYINGVQTPTTYALISGAFSQNDDLFINGTTAHYHGTYIASNHIDGYLAEINFIDGQALDPSYFGEVSAETGAWIPKKSSWAYGSNGFYLDFKDGTSLSALTADKSGNGNNWTANNISLTAGVTYDWMDDTPSNNFCTLNPLDKNSSASLSDGNLKITTSASNVGAFPSFGVQGDKWYFELTRLDANGAISFGVVRGNWNRTFVGEASGGIGYHTNGIIYRDGVQVQTGLASCTTNDVVGVALDLIAGTVTFYKNNTQVGTTLTGLSGEWFPAAAGQVSSNSVINFGQRPFAYAPPTGFKALCTKNLPAPSILNPKKHFDVVLATGANIKSTAEAVFPSNFLEWIKDRGNANNHQLVDIVRGTSAVLQSNTTAVETTYAAPSGSSVAWLWKAGGAPVTNSAGSIQSQVSANPQAGFSIVTFTNLPSSAANYSAGHGLGVAPKLVILKKRTSAADSWFVWHSGLASATDSYILLNGTAATATYANLWGTGHTASVIGLRGNAMSLGLTDTFVAYCFSEIPGYSKFGSYVGNGSSDGPFVYCGFRPRYVLIKRVDVGEGWYIYDTARDTFNALQNELRAESSAAEGVFSSRDFLSNGFKIRTANGSVNANGGTYIFAAFAEQPFQFANAR